MESRRLGRVKKLFGGPNHSLRVDVCVGFYGYNGSKLDEAYVGAYFPQEGVSSLDVSGVQIDRDSSAIRCGGLLKFHGYSDPSGFRRVRLFRSNRPYAWENRSHSIPVQKITKYALVAVVSDGRVFADKLLMSKGILKEVEDDTIPGMYATSLKILDRWKDRQNV